MELRIFTEPQQGATYEQLLTVAKESERSGFDAFFRSDHYMRIGGGDPGPGPTDSWVTLAGIARETSRIRLGTLMTAATFRLPGPLAIEVAEVDAMSGGRVELGIGAGWFDQEHRAYGIPFPASVNERFERLEEQLQIIEGIWGASEQKPFSFEGKHYRLEQNPGLPKPVQTPRPPILVGGGGTRRTPRIAARHADECNVSFAAPDRCRAVFEGLDRACEEIGRDKGTVIRSVAQTVCCGENEGEVKRRAGVIGRDVEELRRNALAGTPQEIAERLEAFAGVGVTRVYLQVLDLSDLDQLRLLAEQLRPLVRSL